MLLCVKKDSISSFFLLERDAIPNLQDGHHQTALHKACENGYEDIAAALITHHTTDLNSQDLMGRTPLHWTATKGLIKTTELLLSRDVKLLKTKGGEDALHWASRSGTIEIITLLLQKYPNINVYAKNERDESAVQLARTDEIRDLLTAHAVSLGHTEDQRKPQSSQTTSVKRLDQQQNKPKKLTIKLKGTDNKK